MSRISTNTSLSLSQTKDIFLQETKKHPPRFKLMNKMLGRGVARKQFVSAICLRLKCVESLFAFGDNVVACRSALHTQETPNTHKAFRIAASSALEGKGKEGLQISLCQQQSHSGSSLLHDDWPNKPLTGLVLPGAGHGLSIWSCCLVVAE